MNQGNRTPGGLPKALGKWATVRIDDFRDRLLCIAATRLGISARGAFDEDSIEVTNPIRAQRLFWGAADTTTDDSAESDDTVWNVERSGAEPTGPAAVSPRSVFSASRVRRLFIGERVKFAVRPALWYRGALWAETIAAAFRQSVAWVAAAFRKPVAWVAVGAATVLIVWVAFAMPPMTGTLSAFRTPTATEPLTTNRPSAPALIPTAAASQPSSRVPILQPVRIENAAYRLPVPRGAEAPPTGPLSPPSLILMDALDGRTVVQVAADEPREPAGLAKIMTLYLAFEDLRDGRLHLEQQVPVSRRAASVDGVRLKLEPSSPLSVEQAIMTTIVRSANDSAEALGELIGQHGPTMRNLMNERARRIGLSHTHFANASGLPVVRQTSSSEQKPTTTARDMAELTRRLIVDFPQQRDRLAETLFPMWGQPLTRRGDIMKLYPGVDASIATMTQTAGYGMAVSAVRNGRRVVAVVMGARKPAERDAYMIKLLDEGFDQLVPGSALKGPTEGASATTDEACGRSQAWSSRLTERYASKEEALKVSGKFTEITRTGQPEAVLGGSPTARYAWQPSLSHMTPTQALNACLHFEKLGRSCEIVDPICGRVQSLRRMLVDKADS